MTTERPKSSPTSEADAYDAALERLVDTRGISYDDARRELGEPPYELYELNPAAKPMGAAAVRAATGRPRRRRSGIGPQRGEEEGVGYPGGVPPYFQPYVPLGDEQAARNSRHIGLIREDLERRRNTQSSDQ
jgi:hypothetical protein